MTGGPPRSRPPARPALLLLPLLGLLLLVACGSGPQSTPRPPWPPPSRTPAAPTPDLPSVDIRLTPKDLSVGPLPLRAGTPFTVTLVLRNSGRPPVPGLPVMVHLSPEQEAIGYTPFMQVVTVTLPSTLPVTLQVPVHWNLAGGEHRLWVQANRLPGAWHASAPPYPEKDTGDNSVLMDLIVEPFDAYRSDLCPGRVDLELDEAGIVAEPGSRRVRVQAMNSGNQAAYNVPVVLTGAGLSGIAYTPVIPPCGGTADVWVAADRPLVEGEAIALRINPEGWPGAPAEDDYANNTAGARAGASAGSPPPSGIAYDFALEPGGVESPGVWLVLVTVRNLGTRDAAKVPIRIENQAGRRVVDAIPLVQGQGTGVAAIRVGTLWKRGELLTLTVNPADAKGALPEADRANNTATFVVP